MASQEFVLLAEDIVRLAREAEDFIEILNEAKVDDPHRCDYLTTLLKASDLVCAGSMALAQRMSDAVVNAYPIITHPNYDAEIDKARNTPLERTMLPKYFKLHSRFLSNLAKPQ